MSVAYSHKRFFRTLRSALAGALIVGLLMLSIPAPLVFADEGASESSYESPLPGSEGKSGNTGDVGGQGEEGSSGSEGEPAQTLPEEGTDGHEGVSGAPGEPKGENGASTGPTNDVNEGTPTYFGTTSDTSIATGNSGNTGAILNQSNTNVIDVTLQGDADESDSGDHGTTTFAVVIDNDNTATSVNAAEFLGTTGANLAEASGTTTITTGDSVVTAHVINVVNTNIINSNGLMLFLDLLYGQGAHQLDLRNTFNDIFRTDERGAYLTSQSTCSLISCNSTIAELTVNNTNDAYILNEIILRSTTGGNAAYALTGGAYVNSGNAYASANIVNLANTNLIDTNYLLVSVNNFGDLVDDVVFPGMDFFWNLMTGALAQNTSVTNTNTAVVETSATVSADSGANAAAGGAHASVSTGNAHAMAGVHNVINRNMFGGENFYILFRVFGEWTGDVFGLPEGLVWRHTAQGIEIFSDPEYYGASASAGSAFASVGINNTNNATIHNNIQVYALTGDNYAASEQGNASIETGDAYAAASVLNVANTNAVGTNWLMAIFNIFGNWSGNIAFGRPDLWIGGRADSLAGGFKPGTDVRYTFTVTNFGDSPATNVVLTPDVKSGKLAFLAESDMEDKVAFVLGDLMPGESIEVSYDARIAGAGALLNPQTPIELVARVHARENDNNYDDNEDRLTIVVTKDMVRSDDRSVAHAWSSLGDSAIALEKKIRTAPNMPAGGTATFEVIITNTGGPSYGSTLHDILFNEAGETIHHQVWELETIAPGEEIYISYDVFFKETTPPGTYTNHVFVEGLHNHRVFRRGGDDARAYRSKVAKAEVNIVSTNEDELAAAQDALTNVMCDQYLTKYIRWGANNSMPEVAKLQQFLNKFEGAGLSVTGVYDSATYNAVRAFQEKYALDILYPWGIFSPTGYVYYTTQKKINDLYCAGMKTFPLSPAQLAEIERFKAKPEEFMEVGGTLESALIGMEPPRDDLLAEGRTEETRRSQTASVGDAVENVKEIGNSIKERLKRHLEKLMNWMSLKYRDARFSLLGWNT